MTIMDVRGSLHDRYGDRFDSLSVAYHAGSPEDFERELDELLRIRERGLFLEIGKLTRDLNSALERFRFDARIVDLAEKDVPDARQRLEHVLKMTDEAAHRTMDLVEGACPLAERTGNAAAGIAPLWRKFRAREIAVQDFRVLLDRLDAFLPAAHSDADAIRGNLNEVLLAQGYQDLTGQIIRSVMHLVAEVEQALGDLVQLSMSDTELQGLRAQGTHVAPGADARKGFGPTVPGLESGPVVSGQQDVDALLSGLGM
jgi:chemotaxis protein CheZ